MTFSVRSTSSLLRNFETKKFFWVSIAEKMKENMAFSCNSDVCGDRKGESNFLGQTRALENELTDGAMQAVRTEKSKVL